MCTGLGTIAALTSLGFGIAGATKKPPKAKPPTIPAEQVVQDPEDLPKKKKRKGLAQRPEELGIMSLGQVGRLGEKRLLFE